MSGSSNLSRKVTRPPNAFMLFGREERSRIAKENPMLSNKEISKILGKKWHSMTDEQKEKYFKQSRLASQKHKAQFPEYIYCPQEARKQKAEKRRRVCDRRQVVDFNALIDKFDRAKKDCINEFVLPPPEYCDFPLDTQYEKFIYYKGKLYNWNDYIEQFGPLKENVQAMMIDTTAERKYYLEQKREIQIKIANVTVCNQDVGKWDYVVLDETSMESVCDDSNSSVFSGEPVHVIAIDDLDEKIKVEIFGQSQFCDGQEMDVKQEEAIHYVLINAEENQPTTTTTKSTTTKPCPVLQEKQHQYSVQYSPISDADDQSNQQRASQ